MKTRSEKVYVKVNVDCDSKGYMTPKAITWSDGRIFIIEKVKDHCPTLAIIIASNAFMRIEAIFRRIIALLILRKCLSVTNPRTPRSSTKLTAARL